MSELMNKVAWFLEKGEILLSKNGASERVLLHREGWINAFFTEIINTVGNDAYVLWLRTLLECLEAPDELLKKPTSDGLMHMIERHIVPVSIEQSVIPEAVTWDGKGRIVNFYGTTPWVMIPVSFMREFKQTLYTVVTERGARAIIRNAARQGGKWVAEYSINNHNNYKWDNLEDLVVNQDQTIYKKAFAVVGWTYARAVYKKGKDGNYMILAKCDNTYESEGVKSQKPGCNILQNYMDGWYEGGLSLLSDRAVESREVKCRSIGDPYCAFAYKFKDKNTKLLDWDTLDEEWRELDALTIS